MTLTHTSYNPTHMSEMLKPAKDLLLDIHISLREESDDSTYQPITQDEIRILRDSYPQYLKGKNDQRLCWAANKALDDVFNLSNPDKLAYNFQLAITGHDCRINPLQTKKIAIQRRDALVGYLLAKDPETANHAAMAALRRSNDYSEAVGHAQKILGMPEIIEKDHPRYAQFLEIMRLPPTPNSSSGKPQDEISIMVRLSDKNLIEHAATATEVIFGIFQGLKTLDRPAPTEEEWTSIVTPGRDGKFDNEAIRWNYSCAATVIKHRNSALITKIEEFFKTYNRQLLSLKSAVPDSVMSREIFDSLN
jgi:hypothetical protein